MARAKHDWPLIRRQYVEGLVRGDRRTWPTLEDLAKTHGCGFSALRDRAAGEKWTDQRAEWQSKVDTARRDKKADKLGDRQADFDTGVFDAVEAQLAMIVEKMSQLIKPAPSGKNLPLQAGEIVKLTRALRDVQLIGRTALGIVPGSDTQAPPGGVMRFEWVNGPDPTDVDYD